MKKKLESNSVFEFLIAQGHTLTNDDWLDLNLDGVLNIPLNPSEIHWINSKSKVTASSTGLSVC